MEALLIDQLAAERGAPRQAVGHRLFDESRLLRHPPHATPQGLRLDLAVVSAIEVESAPLGIVEAVEQAQKRGLARAGRAEHD